MERKVNALLQVKSFFEEKDKIDEVINSFLFSKQLSREDFQDEWMLFERRGKVYCFAKIYYNETKPA